MAIVVRNAQAGDDPSDTQIKAHLRAFAEPA